MADELNEFIDESTLEGVGNDPYDVSNPDVQQSVSKRLDRALNVDKYSRALFER